MLSTITARLTAKNDEYIASVTGGMGVIDKNTGELRSTFDILQDLSKAWKNLTSVEKQELTEVVAGKTQRSLFTAIMSNFDTAVGATEAALNSEGSALEENNKRMDSLNGKLTQLQSAWQSLARDTINSEVIKSLLGLSTNLVKLADSDFGKFLAVLALSVASFKLVNTGFTSLTSAIITNGRALYQVSLQAAGVSASEAVMSASTLGLAGSVKILTTALLSNPLFIIAGVAAGIYGIVKAVDALTTSFDEQVEKVNKASDSYNEAKSNAEENTKELENKKSQLEEINKLEGTEPTTKYDKQKASLESEIKTLEAKKKILDEIEQREKEKLNREAKETLKTKTGVKEYASDAYAKGNVGFATRVAPLVTDEKQVNIIDKINTELNNYNTLMDVKNSLDEKNYGTTQDYANAQEAYQKKIDETKDSILEASKSLIEIKGNLDENDEESKNYIEQIDNIIDRINTWTNDLNALDKEQDSQSTEELTEREKELESQTNSARQSFSNLTQEIDNLQKTYKTLTTAVDEYNNNGYLSIDTLQSLLSLDDEYLSMLSMQNGQLVLNTTALDQKVDSLIATKVQELEAAAATDLYNLAQGNTEKMSALAKTAIANSGDAAEKTGNKFQSAVPGIASFTGAMLQAKAAAGDASDPKQFEADANKIIDAYKNAYKSITELGKSTTAAGGTSGTKHTYAGTDKKKKSGSSKSSKKKEKEEYKAEIDTLYNYENALDNAKDEVDRLKDTLSDTDSYDEQEKYINQLIAALNNQIAKTQELKNAQSNQIQDYINQLRAQGFAIDYNAEKNELYINNMQHLADFSGDTAKSLEKIIKKIQDLNSNNRTLDGSVRDLTGSVKDYYDQLADIPEKKLEKFNDLMKEFQQSQLDAVQNQIDDLKREMEKDPRLAALEKEIEALEKENDTIDKQKEMEEKLLAVEEARQKLQNAMTQKTLQVYREGQGWVWEVDPDKVKEAQDELKDAQDALNEQIKDDKLDKLKEEQEAIKKSYQDQIDNLESFLDDQNYIIDKANREGIQSFEDLRKKLAEFGLDSAENLKKASDWLNQYNDALSKLNQTATTALSNSTAATNGLIYSSATQNRIDQALSGMNIDTTMTSTPVAKYDKIDQGTGGQNIYIDTIELPNVSNANEFVEALKDLPRLATTQSSSRK